MITRNISVVLTVTAMLLGACGQSGSSPSAEIYTEEINKWHEERIRSLEEEDSWLSLSGLYLLEQGENTFGSDSANDIVFPAGKAPDDIGRFILDGNEITVHINPGVEVTSAGDPVTERIIAGDEGGEPEVLSHGSLRWYVIERRGSYYVRLKDTSHPNFADFEGIDRFPVSQDWRIKATFRPYDEPQTINIPDILGDVYQDSLFGLLEFEIDGKEYTLAPLNSPESDRFFIIFGDETNGDETYGGGRYVYIDTPGEDNSTYIDFNRAYNPPCVFTDFATCPLPPPQNRLPVRIEAGEKITGKRMDDRYRQKRGLWIRKPK